MTTDQKGETRVGGYDTFNAKAWMRRALAAEDELRRILAVLPEPVWSERRVLVWSMLDIERAKRVLETRR
jgi:hypothetical protein